MVRLLIIAALVGMGFETVAQELSVTKYQASITVHAYPRVIYNGLDKSGLGTCFNSPIRSDWTFCYSRAELESQFPPAKAALEAETKKKELVPVEIKEVKPSKPQADNVSNAANADYVTVQINN